MKTKSTTDTLVTERCCKSTIPFILDDPKSIEGIGETLIDLCNGRQIGNMKVGLRKPKSIPIICANFSMGNTQRYYRFSLCSMVVTLIRKLSVSMSGFLLRMSPHSPAPREARHSHIIIHCTCTKLSP